jgi:hypothetical protein
MLFCVNADARKPLGLPPTTTILLDLLSAASGDARPSVVQHTQGGAWKSRSRMPSRNTLPQMISDLHTQPTQPRLEMSPFSRSTPPRPQLDSRIHIQVALVRTRQVIQLSRRHIQRMQTHTPNMQTSPRQMRLIPISQPMRGTKFSRGHI